MAAGVSGPAWYSGTVCKIDGIFIGSLRIHTSPYRFEGILGPDGISLFIPVTVQENVFVLKRNGYLSGRDG